MVLERHKGRAFSNGLQARILTYFACKKPRSLRSSLPASLKQIEGYEAYFAHAERKGYSGVAVYTKSSPLQVASSFNVDALAGEGRVLEVNFDDFVLFNVYFPNGKSSAERLKVQDGLL